MLKIEAIEETLAIIKTHVRWWCFPAIHSVEIQDFSVIQNLREINFGESRGSKTTFLES